MIRTFLLLLCLLPACAGWSAQSIVNGETEIHYTAFSSLLIPPDVAALHGIARAENRIVVNVSARDRGDPVALEISGQVTNLLEQTMDLVFTEVREADAIYYLANFIAMEEDILRFSLTANLTGEEPREITFIRRYD